MLSVLRTYGEQINAGCLSSREEWLQIEYSIGGKITRLALQQSPVDIERDAVEAQRLDLLEYIEPQAGNGDSVGS